MAWTAPFSKKACASDSLETNLISNAQAGFRSGYSTMDHVITLKFLVDIHNHYGYGLFCAFIDFKKCFDKIDRIKLWQSLISAGLKGRIYQVIVNMYDNAKSCILSDNGPSDFFNCNIGVRQGENLSPLLFSIFLKDIETFFSDYNCRSLDIFPNFVNMGLQINQLRAYLKLYLLLYADDTILVADTAEDLQKALNCLNEYCISKKLTVNTSKTKVMVFTRKRNKRYNTFNFGNTQLEIVDQYTYLGVIFAKNGKFFKTKKYLCEQANKALFAVLQKGRKLNLPLDLQLKLFDEAIEPILLYGSEVWGYEDIKIIEAVHLKYCKYLLKLKKSTPSMMIYGETGRFPLSISLKCRIINFWARLIMAETTKISSIMYRIMFQLHVQNMYKSEWISFIEKILNEAGMGNIWASQSFPSITWLKTSLKTRLQDQFRQNWNEILQNGDKYSHYRQFKTELKFENYLSNISACTNICKLRTMNLKLPNNSFDIQIIQNENNNNCTKCEKNTLADEFHFLLECPSTRILREKYLPPYFARSPNRFKFCQLVNSRKKSMQLKLSKFIYHADIEYKN